MAPPSPNTTRGSSLGNSPHPHITTTGFHNLVQTRMRDRSLDFIHKVSNVTHNVVQLLLVHHRTSMTCANILMPLTVTNYTGGRRTIACPLN